MRAIVVVVLLLCSSMVHADSWSKEDKEREAAFIVLDALDWAQTRYIASHPERFQESYNWFLSSHPTKQHVNNVFVAEAITQYAIARLLPGKWRAAFQYSGIVFEAGMVGHNYKIGIGFEF